MSAGYWDEAMRAAIREDAGDVITALAKLTETDLTTLVEAAQLLDREGQDALRWFQCVCAELNTRHCPVHGQDSA